MKKERKWKCAAGKRARSTPMIAPAPPKTTLVYHGTFGPCHPGHGSVVRSGVAALKGAGLDVEKVVIGITLEEQAAHKIGNPAWCSAFYRLSMIRAVLHDMQIHDVTVEDKPCRTAWELSDLHACPSRPPIFLMGSDLQQRPSTSTLIVARQHRSLRTYFDDVWWSGVCHQDAESSLSSTLVRSFVQRGAVPANYGVRSKTLLSEWVGAPLQAEAVPVLTATSDQTYRADRRGGTQTAKAKAKAKAKPI
eukprot:6462062-Amphidinium_carterae.1